MSAEVWQAVSGWGGWGFVAFLATSAIGVVAVLYVQHGLFLKQLAHPGDRERVRAELTTDAPAGRRFRNGIDTLLGAVDRYFGPAHRWRAFDRCLLHACLYPIVLFVIAWASDAAGSLGTIELFADLTRRERLWRTILFLLALAIAFSFRFIESPRLRITGFIRHSLQHFWRDDSSTKFLLVQKIQDMFVELVAFLLFFLWNSRSLNRHIRYFFCN